MLRLLFAAAVLVFTMTVTACAAPGAITKTGYTVQVGAFAKMTNAEGLAAKLKSDGVDAFFFKKDNGFFAVQFGNYRNEREAVKTAKSLKSAKTITTYIVCPPAHVEIRRETPAAIGEKKDKEPNTPQPAKTEPQPDDDNMGHIVAITAKRFVGIPYQWGGNNVVEGMDCSGFVRAVYQLCGLNIPRTSADQAKVGEEVAMKDLREGDIVFFGHNDVVSHVGIYVGNGAFVHAPRRKDEIKISTFEKPGFTKKFIVARRYLNRLPKSREIK